MENLVLLALLTTVTLLCLSHGGMAVDGGGGGGGFRPAGGIEYREVVGAGGRRRLAPFELCLECKCCSNATKCANMPCCFGIDCQLPNKPFGVCAFVPKSCSCLSCSV